MEYQPPQEFKSSMESQPPQKTSMGMEPNMAAALSYLLCWITGLVVFLLEKENNFVRFHAMQSLITFLGLTAISFALGILWNIPVIGWIIFFVGGPLLGLAFFAIWVLLLLKAYQGERYHLPIVGDMAEKYISQ